MPPKPPVSARQIFAPCDDIRFFNNLSMLNLKPKVTAFTVRFSNFHAFSYTSHRFMPDSSIDIQEKWQESAWAARKDLFWWSCVCRKEATKRTVRSWMARRLRHAILDSLKERGFHPDGERIDKMAGPDLFGTAQFFAEAPLLKIEYKELVRQTGIALDKMVEKKLKSQMGAQGKGSTSPAPRVVGGRA